VRNLKRNVNISLNELRHRTWPTGSVDYSWSYEVYTVADVLIGSPTLINMADTINLYDLSHDLDHSRRRWNRTFNPDKLVVFGVIDDRATTGNAVGKAFWADASSWMNTLLLNHLDRVCDIGNTLVKVLSLGFLGASNGCHVEIPLYVAIGKASVDPNSPGDATSELVAHEIGHTLGLVKPYADNGSFSNNLSHSINDELDGGECGASGATFNWDRTLYSQPGGTEPIVSPLVQAQWYPQDSGDERDKRAKAIMSYACVTKNDNTYFEPVDLSTIDSEMGFASTRNFVNNLLGTNPVNPPGPLALSTSLAADESTGLPQPRVVEGERLSVSGTVNRHENTGNLVYVATLGTDAPLDLSFATGYWLVQRDAAGTELERHGVFPIFATSDHSGGVVEEEEGFFAATILRQEGVVSIDLLHDETVLDSYSAGGTAPTVSISSPNGGSFDSGELPVTWTASDADGDEIEIAIDYSPDGGTTWLPIASSSGSGTVNLRVAELPGSSDARIRVTASDGFQEASTISEPFQVADQPPLPFIGSPAPQTSHRCRSLAVRHRAARCLKASACCSLAGPMTCRMAHSMLLLCAG
jgi:hypothetical protein